MEAPQTAAVVRHSLDAGVLQVPEERPAPSAVLLPLESFRGTLLCLYHAWLRQAAFRLRHILAEIDAALSQNAQPTQ